MKNSKIVRLVALSTLALAAPALITACAATSKSDDVAVTPSTPAPVEATHIHGKIEARSKSNVAGEVHLDQSGDAVVVKYDIKGLKKNGQHGFHIHAKGDCSAPDASSAGDHFNPSGTAHGDLHAAVRHAGDFGNIKADKKGVAKGEITVPGLKLNDVKGLAIVVHAKADDGKSQPSGAAGDRIGCGILQ